jgi:Rnl2 family RNA ligase
MEHKILHKAYHHIVNTSVKSCLKKYDENVLVEVQEKVDGSNFYFACDGFNVVRGKKGSLITDTTDFYGCDDILYLKESMRKLYDIMGYKNTTIYLYGELIPTQKRIKYVGNSKSHFIAFDLRVLSFDAEKEEDVLPVWLPKSQWEDVAKSVGFLVIPTLFRGSLKECIDYDVENRNSSVPQLIDKMSSIVSPIEGIVIKGPGFTFKKKAAAFKEIEASGVKYFSLKRNKELDELVEAGTNLIWSMLVPSRIDNIVSEIGDKMIPDAPRLSNTIVLNAIEEAKDDEEGVIHKLSRSKLSKIQKELASAFTDKVKEYMNW